MKQTLINRLILGAFAGLAAVGAHAGQIQASSVSIAREVITTDTQTIISPSIAYRFAGDVDARVQAQTFQVQFTLASGTWNTLPGAIATTIQVSDGVTGQIQDQSAAAPAVGSCPASTPNTCNSSYQVIATGLSADLKTLYATITVNQGATALIKQPLIALNVTANTITGTAATNVSANRASVKGLYSVVGDLVTDYTGSGLCQAVKTAAVSFKHYVALTSPAAIATDSTATADEHTRSGATNAATLMTFPTNVLVKVNAPTRNNAALTTGGNLTFAQSPVTGAPVAGDAYLSGSLAMLGSVSLSQNATGYDGDLAHQYALAGVGGGVDATGLDHVTTAANNVGDVEVNTVTIAVSANNGFVVGGTLYPAKTSDCALGNIANGGATAITAVNAAGPITLTIPNANVNAAFGATGLGPVYVCYTNPGTTAIPSSSFTAVARVNKAAAGANLNEQDNICNGTYTSVGGSIKIDVRNYASSAEASGWQSVIRLINPSDSKSADVWAQLINQDGKLGNYVLLTTLAPRAVQNYTAAQIDAKLAAGSASTAGAANTGTAAAVAIDYGTTAAPTANAGAPRLRITSTTGNVLRVQNYLFNEATGQIVEGSGSQAVDFDQATTRAPANDGQYISQDAQSGLNLQ